jgi:hypothetical protein
VSAVRKKSAELGISHVFFATDVPTATGEMRSHSYRQHSAARMQQASDAADYIMQRVDTFTWENFDRTVVQIDSALQGALDTALCLDAATFITAPEECVGTYSWYVNNIKNLREKGGKGEQAFMTWTVPETLEAGEGGAGLRKGTGQGTGEVGQGKSPWVWAAAVVTCLSWTLLVWYLIRGRSGSLRR